VVEENKLKGHLPYQVEKDELCKIPRLAADVVIEERWTWRQTVYLFGRL
jgi:hypothetical protein